MVNISFIVAGTYENCIFLRGKFGEDYNIYQKVREFYIFLKLQVGFVPNGISSEKEHHFTTHFGNVSYRT
jgi:hypothetical protein